MLPRDKVAFGYEGFAGLPQKKELFEIGTWKMQLLSMKVLDSRSVRFVGQ